MSKAYDAAKNFITGGVNATTLDEIDSPDYSRVVGSLADPGMVINQWYRVAKINGSAQTGNGATILIQAGVEFVQSIVIAFGIGWRDDGAMNEDYTFAKVISAAYDSDSGWAYPPSTALKIIRTTDYEAELWIQNTNDRRGAKIYELSRGSEGSFTYYHSTPVADEPSGIQHMYGSWGVWSPQNDGTGSGLDADMVDGFHASRIVRGVAMQTGVDLDTLKTPGIWHAVDPVNGPDTGNGPNGLCVVFQAEPDEGFSGQLYISGNNKFFYRAKWADEDAWEEWAQLGRMVFDGTVLNIYV